jgi:hypothetical protein
VRRHVVSVTLPRVCLYSVYVVFMSPGLALYRSAFMLTHSDADLAKAVAEMSQSVLHMWERNWPSAKSYVLHNPRSVNNNIRRKCRTSLRQAQTALVGRIATAASSAASMLGTNLSAQRPWCRWHLDMQEDCHSCQMSFALTVSMADAGFRVPARPDSVRLQLSTLGQSYTILVLPTMSVRYLKTELARRFNWNVWDIKLYVGTRSLGDHELVESFCMQTISAVISSSAEASGDAPLRTLLCVPTL